MKKTIIIASLLVIGLAAGWVISKNNRQVTLSTPLEGETSTGQLARQQQKIQSGSPSEDDASLTASGMTTNARPELTAVDLVGDDNLSDADKQQIEKLQAALDAEDLKGVTAAARQLMHSESVAVRLRLAEALGWFGAAAFPEMIELMGDSNAEVVEAATPSTLEAISEMEDGEDKANLLAALLATMTDLDSIDEALNLFAGIDDDITISLLMQLIEGAKGNPDKLALLEAYRRFVNGELLF